MAECCYSPRINFVVIHNAADLIGKRLLAMKLLNESSSAFFLSSPFLSARRTERTVRSVY